MFMFKQYNLIMDFIKNHKGLLAGAAAVAASIAIALYYRSNKGNEQVRLPEVYETDLVTLKSGFTNKIQQIRSRIIGDGVPQQQLVSIAREVAAYIEQRTREVERQDYFKARESRERNRFSTYLEMILIWQREKETQTKELIEEQQNMLNSFGLTQQQIEEVDRQREAILKERVNTAVTPEVIQQAKQQLTLKTQYLKTNGEKLVADILEVCRSWDQASLKYLPNILNVIINEAVYTKHRELIDYLLEISWAIEMCSSQLDSELAAWDNAISPIFQKLMEELLEE